MSEQQTREKMVPMSAIEQACRDVFLDKTTSTVASELHGNMPGIAYYAIWRRCHRAAAPVATKEQVEAAVREAFNPDNEDTPILASNAEIDAVVQAVLKHLERQAIPTDANPTGGAHA